MSRREYEESRSLALRDRSFYSLIMAAMRQADDVNEALLREAWPEVWDELQARYWAPGGILPTEETA